MKNAGNDSIHEQYLVCGGYRTRIVTAGDPNAPAVLLLHDGAWGASADATWHRVIPLLAADRYVIAPDMLGYGGSDKVVFLDRSSHSFRIDHLTAVLEALHVEGSIDVVGNSFGGAVALRALAVDGAFPIRSAVSIAGSGGPWRTATAAAELPHWDGTREDLSRIAHLLLDETDHFDEVVDRRMHWATQPGHARSVMAPTLPIPDSLRVRVDDPWPEQIRGISTPVLLVRCRRDELLEPEWAASVAAVLPRVFVVNIDHKHSPNVDLPVEVVALLRRFWSGSLVIENPVLV